MEYDVVLSLKHSDPAVPSGLVDPHPFLSAFIAAESALSPAAPASSDQTKGWSKNKNKNLQLTPGPRKNITVKLL